MAALTSILLGVGLAASAAGSYMSYKGSQQTAKATTQAENARQRSMNLDAARRRRALVRDMLSANATNTAMATAGGTATSSLAGGMYGSVMGQGGNNMLGVSQNQQLGNEIFSANAQARSGSTMAATGNGLQSLGGAIVQNRETIGRVGGYFRNW